MKYVALLRGINVGGNSMIKMADLKAAFENSGYTNVSTYINSGNVLFESNKNTQSVSEHLEKELTKTFGFDLRVVVKTDVEMKTIVAEVPSEWDKPNDLRCYLAFLRGNLSAKEIIQEVEPKEGIDFLKAGKGVVYMSTKLEGLSKSGLTKFITKKIYKEVTIRNYNTTQKILALIEKM